MFTIETLFNHSLITLIDDKNQCAELEIKLYENCIEFHQWDENTNQYNMILLSTDMFNELIESVNKPDGSYIKR